MAPGFDPKTFGGDTEVLRTLIQYNIMFGPDICGSSNEKVHAIINYKGKNYDHLKSPRPQRDQMTRLFRFI